MKLMGMESIILAIALMTVVTTVTTSLGQMALDLTRVQRVKVIGISIIAGLALGCILALSTYNEEATVIQNMLDNYVELQSDYEIISKYSTSCTPYELNEFNKRIKQVNSDIEKLKEYSNKEINRLIITDSLKSKLSKIEPFEEIPITGTFASASSNFKDDVREALEDALYNWGRPSID